MTDSTELERTPDGFRTRLRYGKGLRGRFLIRLSDEREAAARARRMRRMAEMLAAAGCTAEAPVILKKAGGVRSERDFADIERVAEELCAKTRGATHKRRTPTFREMGKRWTNGTLAREYPDHVAPKKTAEHDESRLDWICSVVVAPGLKFGDVPIDRVTLDHCEVVMRNLPEAVKRPAARRHYAQLIHRVLELAVFPCRLIAASPLPRGFMPKIGKPPTFPYLYPEEDRALLGCTEIPLGRRLLWGFWRARVAASVRRSG